MNASSGRSEQNLEPLPGDAAQVTFPTRFSEENRLFDVVGAIEHANLAELFRLNVVKKLVE